MPHSFSVTRDVEVPMRDGTRLRADLWRPSLPGARPVVLFRTPYDRSAFTSDFFRPQNAVDGGFVALIQDTRGRFGSDGDWRAFDWEQEGLDSYDSVEWAAAQPWCNGAVGMAGPSYLGIVQLAGAALRPPHLKAIAPAVASVGRHERLEHGGALWLDHLFSWLCLMALEWGRRCQAAGEALSDEETAILAKCASDQRWLMSFRPLKDSPLFKLREFRSVFQRLVEGTATPDLAVEQLTLPILAVGGWFDLYLRGTIGLFQDAPQHGSANVDRYLLIGCWTHGATLPYSHGQANFGLAASGAGGLVADHHLTFFRRHLCGEKVEIPRVRYFLMNGAQWRNSISWPPPETRLRRLYLHSSGQAHLNPGDGALSSAAPEGEEPWDGYLYDPADPPPSVGGRILSLAGLIPGASDQTSLAARPDTLCYNSPPVPSDTDLVGPVRVTLNVSSSAVDTDFVCKLIDVAPTGIALLVTDGIVRLRWRNGWDTPIPFRRDSIERISVDLADTAWRVLQGHRLRLQVQSGNYPHLDPNMNTGAPVGDEACGVTARNRVYHDRNHPSYVDVHCWGEADADDT
jgi:uncharacterized protein